MILPKSLTCLFTAVIYNFTDGTVVTGSETEGLRDCHYYHHCAIAQVNQPWFKSVLIQMILTKGVNYSPSDSYWDFLITNIHLSASLFALTNDAHESVRIRICKVLSFDYNHEAMMIQNYALIVDINIIIMSASMLSQDLCCCNS